MSNTERRKSRITTNIELRAYAYLDNLHPQFGSLNGATPDAPYPTRFVRNQ